MPEPEMYVTVSSEPKAFTYGHTKPFITSSSEHRDGYAARMARRASRM